VHDEVEDKLEDEQIEVNEDVEYNMSAFRSRLSSSSTPVTRDGQEGT
jgi:hypothetical protein